MNIVWSDFVLIDFEQNLVFILEEQDEKVAIDFTDETQRVLNIISQNPRAFKKHKTENIHIVPMTKSCLNFVV